MTTDSRLCSLMERWESQATLGAPLTLDDLCRDCPELREPLTEQIALLAHSSDLIAEAARQTLSDPAAAPSTNLPTPPLPGMRTSVPVAPLGYELLGELGRGAMGIVYRARQSALSREVALKMILAGGHAGDQERRRFLAEAEAAAAIRHPGIVQIYDFGTCDGRPYCALELCPGGSLAQKLASHPLPPEEAASLLEKVARAMQAAHEKGIVHRDLKPANILLDADGAPRVSDFGLARKLEGGGALTQTGAILGTPSYMAPEQAQGQKVGPAADIYALGAILYECLTGRPPFQAPTVWDVVQQVIADEPVPVRRLQPRTPRDLETICHRCLAKEPARRYASAGDLADDLARFRAGEPIRARAVGTTERAWKAIKRRPLVSALATLAVVALAAGSVASTWFGLEARNQARTAEAARESAHDKEADARAALAQVEESLAAGLLRPLGHFEQVRELNDFERDALEELATLPPERERVRLLFLDKALAGKGTAGQLDRRLGPALRAAIGLDDARRREVLGLVCKVLNDERRPIEARLVGARVAASLIVDEREMAERAALLLAREFARPSPRADAAPALQRLLKLSGEDALRRELAGLVASARKADDETLLLRVGGFLQDLRACLPREEANRLGRVLAGGLIAQLGSPRPTVAPGAMLNFELGLTDRTEDGDPLSQAAGELLVALARELSPDARTSLALDLAKLGERLSSASTWAKACTLFRSLADGLPAERIRPGVVLLWRRGRSFGRDPEAAAAWAQGLLRLADHAPPQDAAAAAMLLYQRLIANADSPMPKPRIDEGDEDILQFAPDEPLVEQVKEADQTTELLAGLAQHLRPGDIVVLRRDLAGRITRATDDAVLRALVPLDLALADRQGGQALAVAARRYVARLLPLAGRKPSGIIARGLTSPDVLPQLVELAGHLPPVQAAEVAATLAARLAREGDRADSPVEVLELLKDMEGLCPVAADPARPDPFTPTFTESAGRLARRALTLAGKEDDPADLLAVARVLQAHGWALPGTAGEGWPGELAASLARLAQTPPSMEHLHAWLELLAELAPRLSAAELAKASAGPWRALLAALAPESRSAREPLYSSPAFTSSGDTNDQPTSWPEIARRGGPTRAATMAEDVRHLLKRTRDPWLFGLLVPLYVELLAHAPEGARRAGVAELFARIERHAHNREPIVIEALASSLAKLPDLTTEQRQNVSDRLAEGVAVAAAKDPTGQVLPLMIDSLISLRKAAGGSRWPELGYDLARRLAQAGDDTTAHWEALLPHLNPRQQANLLKFPTCGDGLTRAVLTRLTGEEAANVWGTLATLQKALSEDVLASALEAPRRTPLARPLRLRVGSKKKGGIEATVSPTLGVHTRPPADTVIGSDELGATVPQMIGD